MSEIFTVPLPDIGEGVVEGEVIEWLKKINDPVQQDEPVVVVMTDKATVELPAPHPGKLVKQYYQPGQIAIKGKPLYDIELTSAMKQPIPRKTPTELEEQLAAVEIKQEQPLPQSVTTPQVNVKKEQGKKSLATPPARKLARDLGLDINLIPGTGKEESVTVKDIANFHAGIFKEPSIELSQERTVESSEISELHLPDDEIKPLIGIRKLMAKRMAESKKHIPHFAYFEQVDATRLVQLKQNIKKEAEKEGIHVTFMPLLIKALSLTLKRFPEINSSFDFNENKLLIHQHHNIGIAISTPMGLIVPVLKDVQDKSLDALIHEYDALKEKATTNKLHSNDMKDGTITISNFGVLGGGGLWATPIINYPESAILAVARIQKQPIIKNEAIAIKDVLNLSWSFDHRIIDGDRAAACSHYFCSLILNPAQLL